MPCRIWRKLQSPCGLPCPILLNPAQDSGGGNAQPSSMNWSPPPPGGKASVEGRLGWEPALAWEARANLDGFDLGYFLPGWDGRLSGQVLSSGARQAPADPADPVRAGRPAAGQRGHPAPAGPAAWPARCRPVPACSCWANRPKASWSLPWATARSVPRARSAASWMSRRNCSRCSWMTCCRAAAAAWPARWPCVGVATARTSPPTCAAPACAGAITRSTASVRR